MNWRLLPMPRLLLPMAVGICIGDKFKIPPELKAEQYWVAYGGLGLLLVALAIRPSFRGRSWFGSCIFLVICGLGIFRIQQSQFWQVFLGNLLQLQMQLGKL